MTTQATSPLTQTDSATPIVQQCNNVNQWNARYSPLTFEERIEQFYKDFGDKKILLTSSFGTSSVLLLHWVSQANQSQKVHFVDTTYHFPETLDYKNQLAADLRARSFRK